MRIIKQTIKKLFSPKQLAFLIKKTSNLRNLIHLIINTYNDGILYYRHSMVFRQDSFNKIESRIVLHYHGIEKGFLHENFRFRFAEVRIKELIKLLTLEIVVENKKKTQIAAAYLSMCTYYERHISQNIDISDYYSEKDYDFFKKQTTLDLNITKDCNKNSYFKYTNDNFLKFSKSRSSVRSFTGEKIPFQTIEKVIEVAKTAPSVCNRQPTKVYYVENKDKIDKILQIQEGLNGYTKGISQLMIVVTDRNYFYSIGERNQLYVDGGIFLMNLLYALHFYKIAACPAHWGHNHYKDKEIMRELSLAESEKVICVIPIGIAKDNFKTTLSLRRNNDEILKLT